MIVIAPEKQASNVEDLFASLQNTVLELRNQAEDLKRTLEAGQEADPVTKNLGWSDLSSLIRNCQKVETCLVEQKNRQNGVVQNGYALDLETARVEIGCRLDRLRRCCHENEVP